jgi:hypothetical protein
MRKLIGVLYLILLIPFIDAQEEHYDGRQYGGSFSMAESGASASGYYRWPVLEDWTAGFVGEFHLQRDKNQIEFADYYYQYQFNKTNNLYFISLYTEAKKRIWKEALTSTMRPYFNFGIGAVYGFNYPESINTNEFESVKPPDQFEWALQGTIGFGVDISTGKRFTFSIRPQYRYIHFQEKIAGTQDHSAFEIRFEIGITQPE